MSEYTENENTENEQNPSDAGNTEPKTRGRKPKAKPQPSANVGDIVFYVTISGAKRPAIISAVLEEGTYQVTVFNSSGSAFVPEVSFGDADQAGTLCHTY